MKFFFDRNTCRRTARMLGIFEGNGHFVRHHDDDNRFNPRSSDEFILTTLRDEDPTWIFVSGDGNILKNKAQATLLAELNLTFLCLAPTWCNRPVAETAWMMVKGWPNIIVHCERLKEPSILIWKFGGNGDIDIKGTTAALRPTK